MAAVVLVTLLLVGPRWPLRSPWIVAGVVVGAALAAPYVIWQAMHGWPQLTVAGNIGGSAEGGRVGFVPFQLVMVSPVLVPVWVAGLVAPFRRQAWRRLRFVPLTYLLLAALYIVGNGKAYYLASLYPALLGLGSVPTAEWTLRAPQRTRVLATAVVVSAAISAVLALPLLSETALQGSVPMAINPDRLARPSGGHVHPDRLGGVARDSRSRARRRTAIFTYNYGEAGAIDLLGRSHGLPRAYSGHNGFSEWGIPPAHDAHALVIGADGASDAAPYFAQCRRVAVVNDGVGLDNDEQGLPLLLCLSHRVVGDALAHLTR